jgi:AbrB family looped-hinge helix DNA binding protein
LPVTFGGAILKQFPVKLGEGGRVVIPVDVRKELGIDVGDELMLHMEEGKLVLLTRKQAIQYVQEQMAKYEIGDRVLSQELIDDRRRETE